jgi:hypothetical protein
MTSASRKDVKYDPLFDYTMIRPVINHDDDDDDDLQIMSHTPRQGSTPGRSLTITDSNVGKENRMEGAQTVKIVDDNDWLEAPLSKPGCQRVLLADPTLLKLRQQKQELENILQASARNMEEASRLEAQVTETASPQPLHDRSEEAPNKRQKILLKLQGESGETTGVRICVDDKLEKAFTHYAKNVGKRPLTDFVFRFDGQQLDANSSPKDLDLEDEDIVEVHVKKART